MFCGAARWAPIFRRICGRRFATTTTRPTTVSSSTVFGFPGLHNSLGSVGFTICDLPLYHRHAQRGAKKLAATLNQIDCGDSRVFTTEATPQNRWKVNGGRPRGHWQNWASRLEFECSPRQPQRTSEASAAPVASPDAAKHLSPERVARPDRCVQGGLLTAPACAIDARNGTSQTKFGVTDQSLRRA